MDPITATAIIAALTAGVAGGVTEVGKKALVDAYDTLKAVLKKKLGVENEAVKAVENLEAKPGSTSRQGTLKEEIEAAKADHDSDIYHAAQALLDQINAQPGGNQLIKDISGKNVIGNISMQGKFNTSIGEASGFTIGDNSQVDPQQKNEK